MTVDCNELRRLRRARDCMDREYAAPLDIPALARTASMSESHFVRRFHEEYSETPYAYLMTRRIERAMALLSHTDLTITDIAFTVGWASLGSFSTRFHELVGFSPSTYRTVHGKTSSRLSVCQTMAAARPGRHIRRDS